MHNALLSERLNVHDELGGLVEPARNMRLRPSIEKNEIAVALTGMKAARASIFVARLLVLGIRQRVSPVTL